MRTRSFFISLLLLGSAAGWLLHSWRAVPSTQAASNPQAAKTFTQIMVGFADPGSIGEYFKDFGRSRCQRDEIFRLQDEMDATRTTIRTTLYQGKDATDLVQTYRDQTVELYYLRKFVISPEVPLAGVLLSGSVEDVEASNPGRLEHDMSAKFVQSKQWYSDPDFATLYAEIEDDYESRKEEFLDCGGWKNLKNIDPDFQEIKDRLDRLVTTFEVLKNAGKSFGDAFKPEEKEMTKTGIKNADKGSVGGFFAKHFGFTINNTCPKKGLSDIVNDLNPLNNSTTNTQNSDVKCTTGEKTSAESESDTNTGNGGTTFSQVALLSSISDDIYVKDFDLARHYAKFISLYKYGSDSSTQDLSSTVESLDVLIQQSVPPLKDLKQCAKTVNDKFCS